MAGPLVLMQCLVTLPLGLDTGLFGQLAALSVASQVNSGSLRPKWP